MTRLLYDPPMGIIFVYFFCMFIILEKILTCNFYCIACRHISLNATHWGLKESVSQLTERVLVLHLWGSWEPIIYLLSDPLVLCILLSHTDSPHCPLTTSKNILFLQASGSPLSTSLPHNIHCTFPWSSPDRLSLASLAALSLRHLTFSVPLMCLCLDSIHLAHSQFHLCSVHLHFLPYGGKRGAKHSIPSALLWPCDDSLTWLNLAENLFLLLSIFCFLFFIFYFFTLFQWGNWG